jgi:hypothetical protein
VTEVFRGGNWGIAKTLSRKEGGTGGGHPVDYGRLIFSSIRNAAGVGEMAIEVGEEVGWESGPGPFGYCFAEGEEFGFERVRGEGGRLRGFRGYSWSHKLGRNALSSRGVGCLACHGIQFSVGCARLADEFQSLKVAVCPFGLSFHHQLHRFRRERVKTERWNVTSPRRPSLWR